MADAGEPASVGDLVRQHRLDARLTQAALADRLQTSIVPLLVDVVHHCGGTVSRVGGDTLMAIFGAPLAREDDTVRACIAALALHEAFDRFARRLGEERGLQLALRVGLAS